jgi:hypothetical protein
LVSVAIVILRFPGMVQFAASNVRGLSAVLYRYFQEASSAGIAMQYDANGHPDPDRWLE